MKILCPSGSSQLLYPQVLGELGLEEFLRVKEVDAELAVSAILT